jgi:hypothetical protein
VPIRYKSSVPAEESAIFAITSSAPSILEEYQLKGIALPPASFAKTKGWSVPRHLSSSDVSPLLSARYLRFDLASFYFWPHLVV